MHGQTDLLEIVDALGAAGGFASRLHGGQEQRDQDGDDGDHHQKLDQGKTLRAAGCTNFHEQILPVKRIHATEDDENEAGIKQTLQTFLAAAGRLNHLRRRRELLATTRTGTSFRPASKACHSRTSPATHLPNEFRNTGIAAAPSHSI